MGNLIDAYRLIRLVPDADVTERRAAAIANIVRGIKTEQCLSLLRLYLGSKNEEYAFAFREAFRAVDSLADWRTENRPTKPVPRVRNAGS